MNDREILLVEDSPDDAELTRIAFAETGIPNRLVVVRDGTQALDYLFGTGEWEGRDVALQPALVLLDLNLPKLDGREVLQAIRSNERTRSLPVVVLTTSVEPLDVEASYALGVNSYIRKPLNFEQFVSAIRQVGQYWLVLNQPRSA